MTQDKMRKMITGCVSAATVLLVFLIGFLCYQWITGAVYDNRIDKLQKEIAAIEQTNTEMGNELSFLESPMGKDWLAFEAGFVRDNK